MIIYDINTGDVSTPSDAESVNVYTIDDIYQLLDSIDSRLSEIQINNNNDENVIEIDTASITDATGSIKENTDNIYIWIIVLSFIIVIFEIRKMFRNAISQWIGRGKDV